MLSLASLGFSWHGVGCSGLSGGKLEEDSLPGEGRECAGVRAAERRGRPVQHDRGALLRGEVWRVVPAVRLPRR